jgi:hypothetical protein
MRLLLSTLLVVGLSACGCRKTDQERAAAERAEMKKRYESSRTLTPYRALKLLLRAEGDPNAPEELTRSFKAMKATPDTAAAYVELVKTLYEGGFLLAKHDEDDFPLLYDTWTSGAARPIAGYDEGMEHLTTAVLWWALDMSGHGSKLSSNELIQYELSRATPGSEWPSEIKLLALGLRGASFYSGDYHYAAEEEFTAYLAAMEKLSPKEIDALASAELNGKETHEGLRSIGYVMRAMNRAKLKRDEAAADDMEEALRGLERLGIENELTHWGWTFVHLRRKQYVEAGAALKKVAASPYLDAAARDELSLLAADLEKNRPMPLLGDARASTIVVQALIRRGGGLEKLVAEVVGPEQAKKLIAPIQDVNEVVSRLSSVNAEGIAQEAAEKGKSIVRKGFDLVKSLSADAGTP